MIIAAVSALLAGVLFGLNVHIQHRALDTTDSLTGAAISLGVSAAMLWISSPLWMDWNWWSSGTVILFALCGLLFPAFAQLLQIRSIETVGSSLSAAIGAFAPLFAVVPAVLFLNETVNLQAATGIALLMAGLCISGFRTHRIQRTWPVWALLLPLGASAVRGGTQPIVKVGLNEIPSAFFATLVMTTVSTLVLSACLIATRRTVHSFKGKPGAVWFAVSGAVNCSGILALAFAIKLGGVTLTAPLASTAPLWALFFGALIFRREALGLQHIVVACMVVLGAMLIITR
ncbi:MAG: DMT family transporter [Pseudomonadota bacterium]